MPKFGGPAAALDVAAHSNSLIVISGRVLTDQTSTDSGEFRMGFVAYDGDGTMVGRPWTFMPDE